MRVDKLDLDNALPPATINWNDKELCTWPNRMSNRRIPGNPGCLPNRGHKYSV